MKVSRSLFMDSEKANFEGKRVKTEQIDPQSSPIPKQETQVHNLESDVAANDSSDFSEEESFASSSTGSLPAMQFQPETFGIWPKAAFDDDNGKPLSEVFKRFSNVQPRRTVNVPYDINGLSVIVVPLRGNCSKIASVKDGRPWAPDVPTKWAGFADLSVRRSLCKGGLRCPNINCLYWAQYGHPNQTQFDTVKKANNCRICQSEAETDHCHAKRYVVFFKEYAVVCHEGEHSCVAIEPIKLDKEDVKRAFKENPKLTAGQFSNLRITSSIRDGKDWNELDKVAANLLDNKMIAILKKSASGEVSTDKDDFLCLRDFKQHCDKRDIFYIYKISSRELNPSQPNFVFKTSKTKLQIARNMNIGSGHAFLEGEPCFFDGKAGKLRKNLKTLTLSMFHPLLCKQIPLAVMDCESENTENVVIFWKVLNECIQLESGETGIVFNPHGFCFDMAACNREAGVQVFGNGFLDKIKSCEFHFKQCRNRHRQRLPNPDDRETFTKLTDALLTALTIEAFEALFEDLHAFVEEDIQRIGLKSWLKWWYNRRDLIFPAFTKHLNVPRSNLAEVIHASWANRREVNLSLLDACAFDVKESYELDLQLKEFESGRYKGGSGPNLAERSKKRSSDDRVKAKRYADQIFEFSVPPSSSSPRSQTSINPSDSHRADLQRKENVDIGRETKFRDKRSKTMLRKIDSAISAEKKIKVKSVRDKDDGREYQIMGATPTLQKEPYLTFIGLVPQCSCPDHLRNSNGGPYTSILSGYTCIYLYKLDRDDKPVQQIMTVGE
eukprot:Seg7615.1 transcript_id=Seg7615.1/GoldUCD/mRNA.D3Y31 product="hypothetical protein" protein_id=Seg7615.1/GoldUCD/D3Y31